MSQPSSRPTAPPTTSRNGHWGAAGGGGAPLKLAEQGPGDRRQERLLVLAGRPREDRYDQFASGWQLDVGRVMDHFAGPTRLRPQLRTGRECLADVSRHLVLILAGWIERPLHQGHHRVA